MTGCQKKSPNTHVVWNNKGYNIRGTQADNELVKATGGKRTQPSTQQQAKQHSEGLRSPGNQKEKRNSLCGVAGESLPWLATAKTVSKKKTKKRKPSKPGSAAGGRWRVLHDWQRTIGQWESVRLEYIHTYIYIWIYIYINRADWRWWRAERTGEWSWLIRCEWPVTEQPEMSRWWAHAKLWHLQGGETTQP